MQTLRTSGERMHPCLAMSLRQVETSCTCGVARRRELCAEAYLDEALKEAAGTSFKWLCNKTCGKVLSCGRHVCILACCDDPLHLCPEPCGRQLPCGLHFCEVGSSLPSALPSSFLNLEISSHLTTLMVQTLTPASRTGATRASVASARSGCIRLLSVRVVQLLSSLHANAGTSRFLSAQTSAVSLLPADTSPSSLTAAIHTAFPVLLAW